MKKAILFFSLFFIGISWSFSQELPQLKKIKLSKKVHFKDAEPTVLKVIYYLFATPIDKKNKARAEAGQFLMNWMNGTPEYTFYLEERETNYFNTDADLMLMYMASLTKFTLANKNIADKKTLAIGAIKLALDYLNTQEDKKNWSKELWQLNDANQKDSVETFLYQ